MMSDPSVPSAPPVPSPPAPRWHPLVRSILFLVAFFVSQLVATLLVAGGFWVAGREMGLTGGTMVLIFVVTAPVLVLLTLPFLRWLDRRNLASLGARWPDGGPARALRQAIEVPLCVLALLGLWMLLVEVLPASDVRIAGLNPAAESPGGALRLLLLLFGFLIQGGVEEWIFRGYIYRALKERWPWWVATLVTALGFALMHTANPDFTVAALVNTFLAGVLLALLVERSGSLWSAVLAHGVWNFSVASIASLPVSGVEVSHLLQTAVTGPSTLTGGGFGPEGSLLLTPLALPLAAILWPRRSRTAGLGVSSSESP